VGIAHLDTAPAREYGVIARIESLDYWDGED
jgi:hypothetical protein